MKIRYDKEIDAKSIRLKEGQIERTKKIYDWLLFDLDQNGDVVAVEILDTKRHPMSISMIKDKISSYKIEQSAQGEKESLKLTFKSPDYAKDNQLVTV